MIDLDSALSPVSIERRPYQNRVMTKGVSMFAGSFTNRAGETEPAAKSVMYESPTGSGKTVMGWGTCRTMQVNPAVFGCDELAVVWTTMRRNVLRQAEQENMERGFGVKANYLSMFATSIPQDLLYSERRAKSGLKVLMVPDEAQHDATNSMAWIHGEIKPDFTLGLSATPYRTDRAQLCFQKVVKDAGIHALIREGYLSQFDHFVLPDWEPETVARHYLDRKDYWGKSLFFFQDFERCRRFNELVRAAGLRCDIVTGSTDRESQTEALERGDLDCLANMYVLTEGFDCPSLKSVWVRDSGKGPTVQMAGRVLRKWAATPRKNVIQSCQTRFSFLKMAAPVNQWVFKDGVWTSLQVNPKIGEFTDKVRKAIISTPVPAMPAWLNKRTSGKKRGAGETGLAQSAFPSDAFAGQAGAHQAQLDSMFGRRPS